MLLDALRGTRPTKTSTGQLRLLDGEMLGRCLACCDSSTCHAGEASSSTIALSSMLRPNMQVSLFHTPALTGILKR